MATIPGPVKEVKVGKKVRQYWDSHSCDICQAVNSAGKPIRLELDRYAITHTEQQFQDYLEELEIIVDKKDIRTHLNSHSKYISEAREEVEKAVTKYSLSRVDKLADEFIDADDLIQDIINVGGKKVREGNMPVDQKLLLGALKEQGMRKKTGSLHDLLRSLDKGRFMEGEIVAEDKVPELPESNG